MSSVQHGYPARSKRSVNTLLPANEVIWFKETGESGSAGFYVPGYHQVLIAGLDAMSLVNQAQAFWVCSVATGIR